MGNRLKLLLTGGSPLNNKIFEFIKAIFPDTPINVIYGITEAGTITKNGKIIEYA